MHRLLVFSAVTLAFLTGTAPCYAQFYDAEGNGVLETPDGIVPKGIPNTAPQYVSPTTVEYVPTAPANVAPKPAKHHWYDSFKHKAENTLDKKEASLIPKPPKEEGRQFQILPDALIRLSREITYEGVRVAPGIYLLSLTPGASGPVATLDLKQRDQVFLTLPVAHVTDLPKPHTQPVTITAPPQTAQENDTNPRVRRGRGHKPNQTAPIQPAVSNVSPPKPAVVEKKGRIGLGADGASLIFILEDNYKSYQSIPVEIGQNNQQN